MKKINIFLGLFMMTLTAVAQETGLPGWYKKVQKSIMNIVAYDENQEMIHEGVGFVVSTDGMLISNYNLFKDAYSAVAIDSKGKKYEVERIHGADNIYGIVRFSINAEKTTPVKIASATSVNRGAEAISIGLFKSKPNVVPAWTVEKKDLIDSQYGYYTLSGAFDKSQEGLGAFTSSGELIGIIQSAVSNKSGVIDASMALSLSMAAIQSRNAALSLNSIHIKKALPDTAEESLVYLFFRSTTADDAEYMDLCDQHVQKFPDNAEGYFKRATPLIDLHRFDEADQCLEKYISLAADKPVAYSNTSQIIYSKLLFQPEPKYDKWSFDTSLELIDKAIDGMSAQISAETDEEKRIPLEKQQNEYIIQKAKILSAKGDHRSAIALYDGINQTRFRGPSIFMASSLEHGAAGDSLDVQIALIDSALAQFPTPLPADAAPYVLQRARLYEASQLYKQAVADFNTFLYLKNNKVNHSFYYDRSLLETNARMYQQAIDDINMAISLAPDNASYYLEKSSICLRVSQIDESIEAARKCISLAPEVPDAYRMLGYALVQKGDKAEALRNLEKAKQLGDPNAQDIIDRYLK